MGDMSREPSMEEILSSIRRVIARDESARTGGAPLPSPAALAEPAMLDPSIFDGDIDEQDDVLELTQMSDSDMARRPASPPASDKSAPEGLPDPELHSPVSAVASRHSLDTLAAVQAGEQESKAAPTPWSKPPCARCSSNGSIPICRRWSSGLSPPKSPGSPAVAERLNA